MYEWMNGKHVQQMKWWWWSDDQMERKLNFFFMQTNAYAHTHTCSQQADMTIKYKRDLHGEELSIYKKKISLTFYSSFF